MFTLFLRGMLLYGVMILTMRLLGKRQLGEFQPFELALTILLADIISEPMGSVSTPLLHGLLPVAAVIVVHGIISLLCLKFDGFRAEVSGTPPVVVERGVIDQRALNRLCLSLADLLEGLRCAGYQDPFEVETAVVEANGTVSAFQKAQFRPVQAGEMNMEPAYEGQALALIMDGRVQQNNLQKAQRDEKWLTNLLNGRGLSAQSAYLASLDTDGKLTLQLRDGTIMRFQAMQEGEVSW